MNNLDPQSQQFEFTCAGCNTRLTVPASTATGNDIQCPQCNHTNRVDAQALPQLAQSPSADPPRTSPSAAAPVEISTAKSTPDSSPPTSASSSATIASEGRDTPTRRLYQRITGEIAKLFIGQDELVLGTLVALFSGGHVLIESVPGLGKTLFVRTLGRILGCDFGRIQFTADLMPSDITGTQRSTG